MSGAENDRPAAPAREGRLRPLTCLIAVSAGFAVGCGTNDAPIEPSWQVDVMPLFAANCVRCHAYPFRGGGTRADGTPRVSTLRLDAFDEAELADGGIASGVVRNVRKIFGLTHGIALLPGEQRMPPDRRLDDYELEVIRNWANLGDGETGVRGPGRIDNHPPDLSVTEVARGEGTVTFAYDLRDVDRDLVVGSVIGARRKGIPPDDMVVPDAVIGNLVAGRGELTWDVAGLDPGDYPIIVRLDDGADIDGPEGSDDFIEVELGVVTLP